MKAITSEIVHLLKVKLSLQMARDGFSCFLGFQNVLGENTNILFQIRNYLIYFSTRHCSTQTFS